MDTKKEAAALPDKENEAVALNDDALEAVNGGGLLDAIGDFFSRNVKERKPGEPSRMIRPV